MTNALAIGLAPRLPNSPIPDNEFASGVGALTSASHSCRDFSSLQRERPDNAG